MARQTKEEKRIDHIIELAYYKHDSGVQINMMDIPNIYRDCRPVVIVNGDVDVAMLAAIERYRIDE